MNNDESESLGVYAGTLYIRHRTNGVMVRYNVEFLEADRDGGENDPSAIWRFQVVTTSPLKIVRRATSSS